MRLTPDEVRAVIDLGFDAQLHTHTHRNVVEHRQHVRQEVRANRESLERLMRPAGGAFLLSARFVGSRCLARSRGRGCRKRCHNAQWPQLPETPLLSLRRYLTGEAMSEFRIDFGLSGSRWLARAPFDAKRYAPVGKAGPVQRAAGALLSPAEHSAAFAGAAAAA